MLQACQTQDQARKQNKQNNDAGDKPKTATVQYLAVVISDHALKLK